MQRTAEVDGRQLDLTYLEFELLAHLVAHPHRVHTRDQLVTTVWGYGHVGDGRTVDVHVARLRRKLGAEHRAADPDGAPGRLQVHPADRAGRSAHRSAATSRSSGSVPGARSGQSHRHETSGAGRHGVRGHGPCVEAALGRGWEVTVFHRGRHAPVPGARSLPGDRTAPGGLAALADGEAWDAVVDTWSAAPRAVREAARLLRGRAGRYAYVSSCSVYAWPRPAGYTEDAPLVEGAEPDAGQTDYARDKRGGELAAVDAFGERDSVLLVRAGLILGPYENIGRLPWWLGRIARGGPVLAPGPRGPAPAVRRRPRTSPQWISRRGRSGARAARTTW